MFLSLFADTRERFLGTMIEDVKTEVYFDGACPLCKREISLYKKLDKDGIISWVDISDCSPSVAGISRNDLLKRFHVKSKDGEIFSGAEAFFNLWRELPGWKWLGRLGKYPFIVNTGLILDEIKLAVKILPKLMAWVVELFTIVKEV